ncbi:hypothetical protein [Asticcacaulis sp. AC402]|uniref:hypothetical protein n=1 Tax=Asticcacaulis sp. AC402 TaxID=1282361 RepID=UPI0003C40843|nr:hypothetical protein [Asticcacaulis sp. AC402]ESQ73505.1 hypothetical protein ABAC402_18890 [Asticcacaulis sp. AC402]
MELAVRDDFSVMGDVKPDAAEFFLKPQANASKSLNGVKDVVRLGVVFHCRGTAATFGDNHTFSRRLRHLSCRALGSQLRDHLSSTTQWDTTTISDTGIAEPEEDF